VVGKCCDGIEEEWKMENAYRFYKFEQGLSERSFDVALARSSDRYGSLNWRKLNVGDPGF